MKFNVTAWCDQVRTLQVDQDIFSLFYTKVLPYFFSAQIWKGMHQLRNCGNYELFCIVVDIRYGGWYYKSLADYVSTIRMIPQGQNESFTLVDGPIGSVFVFVDHVHIQIAMNQT